VLVAALLSWQIMANHGYQSNTSCNQQPHMHIADLWPTPHICRCQLCNSCHHRVVLQQRCCALVKCTCV
jgi:hypothetical protein